MAYTYTTYRNALQVMVVTTDADANFDTILPSCIDYAEQRIYRELNLLNTTLVTSTVTTTGGTRTLAIPSTYVVVNEINLITPINTAPAAGTRVPLLPVSRALIDALWPSAIQSGTPEMFCMVDQWSLVLGPTPDDLYYTEIVGTTRPAPLSASNPTTFLSERLPDLFMAASMVFMSGYQRNFGQQANDPQMGTSWEGQYQLLKASADTEEARKHFWASSWSAYPVSPQAQPQRG